MGRRAAQLWKNQEQLTDLGIVTQTLSIEEQLRVKIALRMMRKSYTKTARSETERKQKALKIIPQPHDVNRIGEPDYSNSLQDETVHIRSLDEIMKEAKANFELTKHKKKMDKAQSKFGQLRPIYSALIDEIRIEEEEKRRIRDEREENEVESVGSDANGGHGLRPSRVGMNVQKRKSAQKRPHSATAAAAYLRASSTSHGLMGSHEAPAKLQGSRSSLLQRAGAIDGSGSSNRRQELLPIKTADVLTTHKLNAEMDAQAHGVVSRTQKELLTHLHNAHQLHSSGEESSTDEEAPFKGGSVKLRVTKHPKNGHVSAVRFAAPSGGLQALTEESGAPTPSERSWGSGPETAALDHTHASKRLANMQQQQEERLPSQMLLKRQTSDGTGFGGDREGEQIRSLVQLREQASAKRSSFFSASAVRDDDRIARAQSQKEEMLKMREDSIRQRIQKKEQQSLTRAELLVHEQRQKAWSIAIVSLARWSVLTELISKHRTLEHAWNDANATKKAIGFIERWWRRGRVRMMFKRHPHVRCVLQRVLLLFIVRLRLRRKRRAATLITTFLQDSTGMSETMRAIYAFRQTVLRLQRWIKGWITVQRCRMRILWIKCERMYREKVRLERGVEVHDDKRPHVSAYITNYFSETMAEIGQRRKKLGRLLEDQEFARFQRQEQARFLEEEEQRKKAAEEKKRRKARNARLGLSQRSVGVAEGSVRLTGSAGVSRRAGMTTGPAKRPIPQKVVVPWHIRIRSSASNITTYELLRDVLKNERRRHVLNLVRHDKMGDECLVGPTELRRYLRDPHSHDGAAELSKKLAEARIVAKSPAEIYRSSFLLLTQGGVEALDLLLRTNRYVKF